MRAVLLLSVAVIVLIGVGAAAFGELGVFGAIVLCFFLFQNAPVKRDDIEATLIILAVLGVILSIVLGVVMPDITGAYY